MKDREKILRYFSATGEEAKDMAIRLLDIADCGSHENGGGENFRRIS